MTTALKAQGSQAVRTPGGEWLFILERSARRALLGIRFWEHGLDQPVTDGFVVTARALAPGGSLAPGIPPAVGRPNPEGVYVFRSLPGVGGSAGLPPDGWALAFDVRDRVGRFLPVVYTTPDPFAEREIFLTPDAPGADDAEPDTEPSEPSDPESGLPGPTPEPRFYLFSSPARCVSPRRTACLRTQLWDRGANRPAAHAVVEVEHGGDTWYGLADERGAALVVFPYPRATALPNGSPPASAAGLYEQSWELRVRVRHQVDLEPVPGAGLPDLGAIVAQPYAPVTRTKGESPAESVTCPLVFGRESVLSTEGESVLWV